MAEVAEIERKITILHNIVGLLNSGRTEDGRKGSGFVLCGDRETSSVCLFFSYFFFLL